MPRHFNEFTDQFFWDFKRMDNVNYNFEILYLLYEAKQNAGNDLRFNKPIIITIVSIIECMLFDFSLRIKQHVSDKIPNLAAPTIRKLQTKQIDVFDKIIVQLEKHNLMQIGLGRNKFYKDLDQLRRLRNRIHIQNSQGDLPRNEKGAYTDANLEIAQKIFVLVIEALCNIYPRWNRGPIPMTEFPYPWKP